MFLLQNYQNEGSYLLPPKDERGGRASCFKYDAVGEEYFLAILTENPVELSWICDATPRDIILNVLLMLQKLSVL